MNPEQQPTTLITEEAKTTARLAALESAVRAWDHGRRRWPTSNVMARIEAVEGFVTRSLAAAQATPDSRLIIQQIVVGCHSSFLHTDYIL